MSRRMILYTSPVGTEFIRTDYKNRSRVDVKRNGCHFRTYRMMNGPFYEHPYLSWANLDCCGGWVYDPAYLTSAVQNHKKLVAEFSVTELPKDFAGFDPNETDFRNDPSHPDRMIVTRKGTLSDFFDMNEILAAYWQQDHNVWREDLESYFSVPLFDLAAGKIEDYDMFNPGKWPQWIITGLALGYPIESTVSVIYEY